MPEIEAEVAHEPVLLDEVLDILNVKNGGVFIDATLGAGGHSEAMLKASDLVEVIGIDQDRDALNIAAARLSVFGARFRAVHANFADIASVASRAGVNGIMADLGVSSMQLDTGGRGFSFRYDAPLDMRMNTELGETAAEMLDRLTEEEIANVIYQYGEERFSRRIARRIVERREAGTPVTTTSELEQLVRRAVPHSKRDQIHPATRTFQALRIAVNGELEILGGFIRDAIALLDTGGRLAIITFHSLEDRIVKQAFLRHSGKCQCPPRIPQCVCGARKDVAIVTKKPLVPSPAEQERNPRSRSAKLRACEKLDQ